MSRRLPAVAGQFYSASQEHLRRDVLGYADAAAVRQPATVLISPHAGLLYSGHVAGAVYSHALLPETVILIGPNHTGLGPRISIYSEGTWVIPGSEVSVDEALAEQILSQSTHAAADESAHRLEHCLEVQLPFLVCARPDIHIVPIVLGTADLSLCKELGRCLAQIIRAICVEEGPAAAPLLVATTDMSHYEPDDITRTKDAMAIEAIERVDPDSLHATVQANRISMCGLGPTIAALEAARELQVGPATLVRYATSGEVNHNLDRVVGYAGFLLRPGNQSGESSQAV